MFHERFPLMRWEPRESLTIVPKKKNTVIQWHDSKTEEGMGFLKPFKTIQNL
jgi:hypothetical protein